MVKRSNSYNRFSIASQYLQSKITLKFGVTHRLAVCVLSESYNVGIKAIKWIYKAFILLPQDCGSRNGNYQVSRVRTIMGRCYHSAILT